VFKILLNVYICGDNHDETRNFIDVFTRPTARTYPLADEFISPLHIILQRSILILSLLLTSVSTKKKLFSLDSSEETVEAAACFLWLLNAFSTVRVSGPRGKMCIGTTGNQELVSSAPSEESVFLCHIH